MHVAALIAASIAALMHVVFFAFESLLFRQPSVWRLFTTSQEAADHMEPMAYNQGFYNLFLAGAARAARRRGAPRGRRADDRAPEGVVRCSRGSSPARGSSGRSPTGASR